MVLRFILFFGIFLAILIGATLFIYFSLSRFLQISDPRAQTALLWTFFLLSFSFFLSAILIRLNGNWFFNSYYFLSGVWLGLLVQLLTASILLWLIFGLRYILKLKFSMTPVASALCILASLFIIYGIWNAFSLRIKTIEVPIKNLPASWDGKSIVQLSDLHLGAIHRPGGLKKIVQKTNALKPNLIVITGDLFDGMDGDLTVFIDGLNQLKAPQGIYFVTGNHEAYLGFERALAIISKTAIRPLDGEVVSIDGLQIIGVGFPMNGQTQNPKTAFESPGFDPKKPSILLYHTPTNVLNSYDSFGRQQVGTYWSPDTDFSYAEKQGVGLQLSGHTHRGQFFPFSLIADWFYRGYDYGLHTLSDFYLYSTSGVGTWGPPLRIGTKSEIVKIKLKKA